MMTEAHRQIRGWTHKWTSPKGIESEIFLDLDESRVQHFRNLNRSIGEIDNWPGCYYKEYASFWVWKGGHAEIASVVEQLETQYAEQYEVPPKTNRQYAEFLKQFVASFPYQYDDRSIGHMEYAKFPIELLYDKEGDCECLSFFLASVFAHAGFDVGILVGYTKPLRKGAHAATGLIIPTEDSDNVIYGDEKYVYCESVSNAPVGKCAFSFDIFSRDASVWPIAADYNWGGQPEGWSCLQCCCALEPWVVQCPDCNSLAMFTDAQLAGDVATDWDCAIANFIAYIEWIRKASLTELGREIEKISRSSIWEHVPSGNRKYFEKTIVAMHDNDGSAAERYLTGIRNQMLSAWPHIVASIFCHSPNPYSSEVKVEKPLRWLGYSVYKMDNRTLALFARKILSDTTCKRLKGFSTGSHLAIGRILSTYEKRGDVYMNEKRRSIENILVKVIIPQVFTLLAREHIIESHGQK